MSEDQQLAALYHASVRSWAAKMRNDRRLTDSEITITHTSPVCGGLLILDVKQDAGVIVGIGYKARACTLGMASMAIVVEQAVGTSFKDIGEVGILLADLLAGRDVMFPAAWKALAIFAAARTLPSRHGSILLPFVVLHEINVRLATR